MAEAAPKKKAAKAAAPTEYLVLRVADHDGAENPTTGAADRTLWEDVAVISTTAGGERACKLAAAQLGNGDKDPKPGRYRAFPSRSDARLDVQAEQKTVVTYSKPKPAAVPAATENGGK